MGENTKRKNNINYIYDDVKGKDGNSGYVAVNVSDRMLDYWPGIKEALRIFTLFTLKLDCCVLTPPSHSCANAF